MQASPARLARDGESIAPDDAAEKLGLGEGDFLDAAVVQTSGVGANGLKTKISLTASPRVGAPTSVG